MTIPKMTIGEVLKHKNKGGAMTELTTDQVAERMMKQYGPERALERANEHGLANSMGKDPSAEQYWLKVILAIKSRMGGRFMPDVIYAEAHAAGMAAGTKRIPVPMRVQEHASPLDDNSPVVRQWDVPEGCCGFAWIKIHPARGPFIKWLKSKEIGMKSSSGGWMIWVSQFGQSMDRKEAYARAFAEVLRGYGLKAYSESRMD